MTSVAKPPPKPGDKKKRKKKRKKLVMRQLKLKGLWMKTPEDWAQFYEWAKKNAVPRKQPPPELIDRGPKKRISKLKKRLRTLSQPRIRGAHDCVPLPRPISPSALKTVASRRTKRLARPVLRFIEGCLQWKVKRSALLYKASNKILMLSLPRFREEPDDCRPLGVVSPAAMRRIPTDKDCELAEPKQRLADGCDEKSIECDDSELSPWVDFLAIPSYRVLKEMNNVELADRYKQKFLDEIEGRSKQAYKEQLKKRKKKKERDKRKNAAKKKKIEEEKRQKELLKSQSSLKSKSKSSLKTKSQLSVKTKSQSSLGESQTDLASDTEPESGTIDDVEEPPEETEPVLIEAEKLEESDEEEEENKQEDDERMKKRKKENDAWRYAPIGCKKFPPEIPKSALNYEATNEIIVLAIPKVYNKNLCKDPYKISEEAKNAVASPRVEELAKPKHQCEPVKRPEPREKDEWGRPIFPPREYGKKLPKVKPYQTRECPKKKEGRENEEGEYDGEDEDSFEDEYDNFEDEGEPTMGAPESSPDKSANIKKKRKRSCTAHPIASQPTIDPLFDPIGAKKQLKERERAKKLKQEQAEKEKAKEAEAHNAEGAEGEDANDTEQP